MLSLAIIYSIVVIAHLFIHVAWFQSMVLNRITSVLLSFNIGQSAEAYRLLHVYNHHRFNNDRRAPDGMTNDTSSTFAGAQNGEHASLVRYAIGGAFVTCLAEIKIRLGVLSMWRIEEHESVLRSIAEGGTLRGGRQIQIERAMLALLLLASLILRLEWTLLGYLPAWFCALIFVNIQNYYEHFGAAPDKRFANSVCHYGQIYNLLTFNDGYHQEHHLSPGRHWSLLRLVRQRYAEKLESHARIVSPVPAIVGYLDRHRARLDRTQAGCKLLEDKDT